MYICIYIDIYAFDIAKVKAYLAKSLRVDLAYQNVLKTYQNKSGFDKWSKSSKSYWKVLSEAES